MTSQDFNSFIAGPRDNQPITLKTNDAMTNIRAMMSIKKVNSIYTPKERYIYLVPFDNSWCVVQL